MFIPYSENKFEIFDRDKKSFIGNVYLSNCPYLKDVSGSKSIVIVNEYNCENLILMESKIGKLNNKSRKVPIFAYYECEKSYMNYLQISRVVWTGYISRSDKC